MKYITSQISAIGSPFFCKTDTGLGNVLFQIASVYGISKKLGIECTFPRIKIYTQLLKDNFNYNHGTTILRNVPILDKEIEFDIIHETFLNDGKEWNKIYNTELIKCIDDSPKNISIQGHLENHNYFSHIYDDIKEMFSCDEITLNTIHERYSDIFNSSTNTVAVHFRDYSKVNNPFLIIDPNYYINAIDYIKQRVNNPLFLIFTDNKDYVDISIFGNSNFQFMKNEVDYIDLYCMSMCKHNIMSASTFSWWASFLNKNPNKIILYNKVYYYEYLKMFIPI